jgi:hypothetical protein
MSGTAHSAAGIGAYLADWRPEAIDTEDVITSQRARQLAATLDLDDEFADGDQLPLLWQWVYFLDWPRTGELGPDGHPRDGHFLRPSRTGGGCSPVGGSGSRPRWWSGRPRCATPRSQGPRSRAGAPANCCS